MFSQIISELKQKIGQFPEKDQIMFNNRLIDISQDKFQPILPLKSSSTIAFVDGGQAEIISASNFSLSFIRVFAQVFQNNQKKKSYRHEFYLLTTAKLIGKELMYESKIYPLNEKLIEEEELLISSTDPSIKIGFKPASCSQVANIARRLTELALAKKVNAELILLDGTLEPTYYSEKNYLPNPKFNSLAKTSHLLTVSGNSLGQLLNKITYLGTWYYHLEGQTYFVKLHPRAKHVFRFEGNPEILPTLMENSQDGLFLGYPYGLIFADKFARVSNQELNSLKTRFLLNKEIQPYLNDTNAHKILDQMN